jgi:recombination protein RecR
MAGYQVAALSRLIEQFERMPGIGRKSAQRLAFYVLGLSDAEAKGFAQAILDAHEKIHRCKICCNLTDTELCSVCGNLARDKSKICVVEDPRDVLAIERTHEYEGVYHVLHGAISPMNGIGPDQLAIKELLARLGGGEEEVDEIIMATNPTVEGEATAMYISRLLKPMGVKVTRLAYGVPVGADLEYADEVTLSRALEGRQII